MIHFMVDGRAVEVPDDGDTLLGALRDHLGIEAVKDGCSPQGQCGCCTVLVDDAPRVACVTPARRVAGRTVTTSVGLSDAEQRRWADAFLACGATQCGFCTPGIVCRLVGHERRGADLSDRTTVDKALAAHLCRCTGWQTIREAAAHAGATPDDAALPASADRTGAAERARMETAGPQHSTPQTVLGDFSFGADAAPPQTLTAIAAPADEVGSASPVDEVGSVSPVDEVGSVGPAGVPDGWVTGETLTRARRSAGKVQGRRTTLKAVPPIPIPGPPPGESWDVSLATCWTEPAYLETDAAWCAPGAAASDPLANGGAFGGKASSSVRDEARRLADELSRPVRVLWSREDTVRRGPKRPPMAAGLRCDGAGIIRIARTPGAADIIRATLPHATIEEVDLPGPPTSTNLRAAPWAESHMLATALTRLQTPDIPPNTATAVSPQGATATATVTPTHIEVHIDAGNPLDPITLRSYAIGATHMAWSWITSECLAVDPNGQIQDLTIRSFEIARSADTPQITVAIKASNAPPVPAGEAVFTAVATATWLAANTPPTLPTGRALAFSPDG